MTARDMNLAEETLDPDDWTAARALAHRMVDDAIDHLEGVRGRPLWQEMPAPVRARFAGAVPQGPQPLEAVYSEVTAQLMPYPMGRCCRTLAAKDSHCESMPLDRADEQAHTRPLPHDELVQRQQCAQEARVAAGLAGQGDDLARAA